MNVQDTASADDKRDMFMQIMDMTFMTHDAAYDFYNSYARANGFSIRKNKVRYTKTRHILCVIGSLFVPDKGNVTASC